MKTARRFAMASALILLASCGGGGSSGGGSNPPPGGPPPPVITGPSSPLPPAVIGIAITPITFTVSGAGPFTWTISAGTLTTGLNLSTSGVLTGTATNPGTFNFTVTVTTPDGTDSDAYSQNVTNTSSELEPNDDAASATALTLGTHGTGLVSVNDVDFWSFPAAQGQILRAELFGIRREWGSWNTNANRPRLQLIGPNGTDYLIGHDYDNAGTSGWTWGDHDLDIPLFRVPTTGLYYARVDAYLAGTQGGSYALIITDVSPGSLQTETEANDDTANANAITPGVVLGFHDDDNDDFYSFDISTPSVVTFEITSYRNGVFGIGGAADDDYFDATLELIAADGSSVLATNYRVYFHDPAIQFHFTTSGTYYVRVTESPTGTDGDADYYLSFTSAPETGGETETNDDANSANAIAYGDVIAAAVSSGSDTDFYSFSGTAGDIVRVTWFDFGAGETASDFVSVSFMIDDSTPLQRAISTTGVNGMAVMRAILPSTGTFYVRVTPDGGGTDYAFQLTLFKDATFESEANDSIGTADAIPGSGRVAGAINSSGDVDVFSFSAQSGEVVVFSIYAGPGNSSNGFPNHSSYTTAFAALLPDLEIVNGAGTSQGVMPYAGSVFSGESVTNGLATSELTFVALTAGTYYIRVTASDNAGDDDHRYVIEKR